MTYDSAKRLTSITDPEGNLTRYEYAAPGCGTCGGSTDLPKKLIDPFGNVTTHAFDHNGRIALSEDPLANLTALVRDAGGRIVGQTDANGNTVNFAYDKLGRLSKQTDAARGVTAFTYDQRGNLLSLTDPEGHVTTFEYDLAGRKTKELRPMGQATVYSYYPSGLLKSVIDAKGQTTSYTYDAASRLTAVTYADGLQDTFAYDAVGNLTGWSGADGVSGSATYDALNRKLFETVNYGGFDKTIAYSYDARGNKATYTSPEGIEHVYSYDKLGRPTAIAFAGQTVSLNYEKTRLQSIGYPNGVTTAYSYNANQWLTGIQTAGQQGTILSRGYGFDPVGNITKKESEHGATSYGYDATYQLTSADHPQLADEAFTYDQVGNRLSSLDVASAISYNANNELIGHSAAVYEYDANGNTVKKIAGGQITNYQYNARNRLEKVYLPDGRVASYGYDPFGRRVSKQVANEVTYFAYADEGLVGEYAAGGQMQKVYGWMPDGLWGTDPLYLVKGGSYYFYHNDHLGTPQRLTDGSGNVAWSAGYAAFGLAVVESTSTIENNLRFPGQYFDAETGAHYNFQRTYDPWGGRYTQVDPIGFEADDENLYRYVQGSPSTVIDPTGEFGLIGAGIGAGLDIILQLATNGGNLKCVDWGQVALSGLLGAVGTYGARASTGVLSGALKHSKSGLSWLKASKKWGAVSQRVRRVQNVPKGNELHHWAISRNGKIGKYVSESIKNHPLNLKSLPKGIHQNIHGNNPVVREYNPLERWWHGTPGWAKASEGIGGVGGGVTGNALDDRDGDCGCKP